LAKRLGVVGLPGLTHTALAKEGNNVTVPEAGAGRERHGLRGRWVGPFYAQAVAGPNPWGTVAPPRSYSSTGGRHDVHDYHATGRQA